MTRHYGRKADMDNRRAARAAILNEFHIHNLLEYVESESFLRITLDFMNDVSPSAFDSLIDNLPAYRDDAKSIFIRMIFKPRHKDNDAHSESRRKILESVVMHINRFQVVSLRFVLNLHYLSLDQIEPASAIYGLRYKNWDFDILTDNVEHVHHDSPIDRLLREQFKKNMKVEQET